uniref:Uncharacterized protein n=1 Tax=Arundo donax TaxID=35708 RepID=A0A0A8XST1_ARUDO
MHPCCPSVSKI